MTFEDLYTHYYTPMYQCIYRYIGQQEQAHDLTQDAFLRIWRHGRWPESERECFSWCYTIARNGAMDARRQLGRRQEQCQIVAMIEDAYHVPVTHEFEERVAQREQVTRIWPSLIEEHRALLSLLAYGYTPHEIAQQQGRPVKAVYQTINHARHMLRTLAAREEQGQPLRYRNYHLYKKKETPHHEQTPPP